MFEERVNPNGHGKIIIRDADTGEIKKTVKFKNIITTPGKFHIVDRLQGRVGVSGADTINGYCALGAGSSTPEAWDSGLDAEISTGPGSGRVSFTSVSRSNQTVLCSTFFDTDEGNGTNSEVGLFVTGYDSGGNYLPVSNKAGSGILFSRAIFSPITKTSSETWTVDWEITF